MHFLPTEDHVKVSGRTIFRDNVRYLGYSATSISFCFTGQKAQAVIISDPADWPRLDRYFYQRCERTCEARGADQAETDRGSLRIRDTGDGHYYDHEIQRTGICYLRYRGTDH